MYVDVAFCTINLQRSDLKYVISTYTKIFLIRKMAQIHDLSRKKITNLKKERKNKHCHET
jgi:hypothetical protein